MSTRASVIVTDGKDSLYFYQHSDGYPEGLGKTLSDFLKSEKAKEGEDDLEYFAGLLVMEVNRDYIEKKLRLPDMVPAVSPHGDESYTYIIDCKTLELETERGSRAA